MIFGITKAKANAKLQRALETGNFSEAIQAYRKLIAKTPNDYELFNNLGIAYLEAGSLTESVEAFQNANRILPACVHFNNLGRALLGLKQYDAARTAFAKGRELDPADPQPWYNITVLLCEEGRLDEAHRELLQFLKAHPSHANGLNVLGCHHLDHGKIDDAIQCFTQAVAHSPATLPARLNLIRTLCDARRYPEATPHLVALAKQGFRVWVHGNNDVVSIDLNGSPFYRDKRSPQPNDEHGADNAS